MWLNREASPKTYANFYKPQQRMETRRRGNVTIIVCIVVIAAVALLRGI